MHKNARLTPKGREVMLGRLQAGQHQVDVAQAMGVSLTTLKKWLRRYRSAGLAGLLDRSSRPARSPRQLSSTVGAQIIDLRRQRRTGGLIARRLGVSGASVSRVLRRAHSQLARRGRLNGVEYGIFTRGKTNSRRRATPWKRSGQPQLYPWRRF